MNVAAVISDQYRVGLGDDISVAVKQNAAAERLHVMYGKVWAMFNHQYHPPVAYLLPIDLKTRPANIYLLVNWYRHSPSLSIHHPVYLYNMVQDPQLISLDHVLMPVSFEYDDEREHYSLTSNQRDILDQRLQEISGCAAISKWTSIFGKCTAIPPGPIKRRGFKAVREPKGRVDDDLDGGVLASHGDAMMREVKQGKFFSVEAVGQGHPCILKYIRKDVANSTVTGQWMELDDTQARSGKWKLCELTDWDLETFKHIQILTVFDYVVGQPLGESAIQAMDAEAGRRV
jgi:hypothetical protein